jgi:hypothetical protein
MYTLKWIVAAVVSVAVVVAIVLGGWAVGWWFNTQNTNRGSHLYQHEYGHQSSLLDDIANKQQTVTDITVQLNDSGVTADQQQALETQRLGVASIICRDASQLNGHYDGLSEDQRQFVEDNCDGASVSADSDLRP